MQNGFFADALLQSQKGAGLTFSHLPTFFTASWSIGRESFNFSFYWYFFPLSDVMMTEIVWLSSDR